MSVKGNEVLLSEEKYDLMSANLLDVMVEDKAKFQSSFQTSGESAIDLFMDRTNPWNKIAHPALPNVIKEQLEINKKRGERRGEIVFRMRCSIFFA